MIRWLLILAGIVMVSGGIMTIWLPLPTGLPMLMIGLPLLLRYSPKSRQWILSASRHHPYIHKIVTRLAYSGKNDQ